MIKDNTTTDSCCLNSYDGNAKAYWDEVFTEKVEQNWHQDKADEINAFLQKTNSKAEDLVLCVGVGDSVLIDELLNQGFANIIANDISEVALQKIDARIGETTSIKYVTDDLMSPQYLGNYNDQVKIWIDRATLHFFTTCKDKDAYFELLKSSVQVGGYAILGVFSKNNQPKCCGLDLQLWSETSLINRMKGFELLHSTTSIFTEKNGNQREYIYTLFKKK